MIPIIRLVNTFTTEPRDLGVCVVGTSRIFSLSYLQPYNTVSSSTVTMLCMRPSELVTGSLHLLTASTHSSHLPAPGNHQSTPLL